MTINELDNLTVTDTYSLIMFALYKLKDDPKYSTLSELTYLLDRQGLLALIEYFGGMTITIPSASELRKLLISLTLYNYVNIEKSLDLNKALKDFEKKGYDKNELLENYTNIVNVMSKYDFGRESEEDVQG